MDTIPLRPDRQIQLEKFAQEHGQTPADALDEAVRAYLDSQTQEFEDDVAAIQEGYDAMTSGRIVSLEEFDQHMRRKYGIPR